LLDNQFFGKTVHGLSKTVASSVCERCQAAAQQLILRFLFFKWQNAPTMHTHYFRFLLRKQPLFTALNFVGLVVGLTAALLLFRYVRYEQNYDRQSPHAVEIWRVFNQTLNGETVVTQDANTHSAVGPTLKAEVPGVVDFARLFCGESPEMVVLARQQPYEVARCYATDPGFFRMFPPRVLHGDAATCLDEPYKVVLTRSQAERFFGDANAVGQPLRILNNWRFEGDYAVSAVVEDSPENTHLKFDLLISYATRYAKGHQDNFESYWDYNYFQMAPGAELLPARQKLADINEKFLKSEGIRLDIQRFTDIHLRSNLTYELEPNGSARAVQSLGLIAFLILGIAFINYVNLTTAVANERSKEVGVRKAIGASRGMLAGQFLFESLLLSAVAFGASVLCFWQVLPWFSDLVGRQLAWPEGELDLGFWAAASGLVALAAGLAGLYPALQLSAFRPAEALRARSAGDRATGLRQGLVVLQFACSIGLIFGVLVIGKQLDFLKNHELGVQLDQIVTIKSAPATGRADSLSAQQLALFKTAAERLSGVRGLATSSVAPGLGINGISGSSRPLRWTQKPDYVQITSYFVETDEPFFDLFGVPVLAGEYRLQSARAARFNTVGINRAMLDALGFPTPEAAIGQQIAYENSEGGATMTVAAVIENFHIESLKTVPKPTLYYCFAPEQLQYLSVKIAPENVSAVLPALQDAWTALYPERPFRYWFLDEHFAQQYRSETQFGRAFGLFAALAIVISCLGLFGLTAHNAHRRTKEIGIRKVLGASVAGITGLLAKDFLKLVLVAILIASPVAYFFMQKWLSDFAYRIDIQWWMFAGAGLAAVAIAFLTVGFQSVRAALANPVKSLRSE
jgi:putative ABC transport system permease protein